MIFFTPAFVIRGSSNNQHLVFFMPLMVFTDNVLQPNCTRLSDLAVFSYMKEISEPSSQKILTEACLPLTGTSNWAVQLQLAHCTLPDSTVSSSSAAPPISLVVSPGFSLQATSYLWFLVQLQLSSLHFSFSLILSSSLHLWLNPKPSKHRKHFFFF